MFWVCTLTNKSHGISLQTLYVAFFVRILWEWYKACACECESSLLGLNQSVNRHLWAAGHLASVQLPHREEMLTSTHTHTLTSTQTVYAYMHRQAAHHHTQTSINTHIYSTTHSHTNTFPLAPTGDRRCHVYWLAGNFNRREWETSSYHCLSPPDMPPPPRPPFFSFFCFFQTSLYQHFGQFICPRQQLSKFYCSPNLNQEGV